MTAAADARSDWKARGVPMEQRRPELLEALNRLYEKRDQLPTADSQLPITG
jgi:hypothetical protein